MLIIIRYTYLSWEYFYTGLGHGSRPGMEEKGQVGNGIVKSRVGGAERERLEEGR